MPKLSLTMDDGIVARWLVEVGQVIEKGQALAEVETDKVTMEMESPESGRVSRLVEPGGVIPVGEVICILE